MCSSDLPRSAIVIYDAPRECSRPMERDSYGIGLVAGDYNDSCQVVLVLHDHDRYEMARAFMLERERGARDRLTAWRSLLTAVPSNASNRSTVWAVDLDALRLGRSQRNCRQQYADCVITTNRHESIAVR